MYTLKQSCKANASKEQFAFFSSRQPCPFLQEERREERGFGPIPDTGSERETLQYTDRPPC